MAPNISPAKALILALELIVQGHVAPLCQLVALHPDSLNPTIVLRLLLTYLPETTEIIDWLPLLELIGNNGSAESVPDAKLDTTAIDDLTEDAAQGRVRKLRLLPLQQTPKLADQKGDPLETFLYLEAYRLDENAGMLDQVPRLLTPFFDHSPAIRAWMAFTVLPFLRRESAHGGDDVKRLSLRQFEEAKDDDAVLHLLNWNDQPLQETEHAGRWLRRLIGPWIHDQRRWHISDVSDRTPFTRSFRGWQAVLQWLVTQAATSWQVAVSAFEEWEGPCDLDLGDSGIEHPSDCQLHGLQPSYAKAAIGSAYLLPEPTLACLDGAWRIVNRARCALKQDPSASLTIVANSLPSVPEGTLAPEDARVVAHLRNDVHQESNCLTEPNFEAVELVSALTLSAYILTRMGIPCSVRKAGTLALLRDKHEQKNELTKLMHHCVNQAPLSDPEYWAKTRQEILWLHNWGRSEYTSDGSIAGGIFGTLAKDDIEAELLKSMLSNTCYPLARSIYEETAITPLSERKVQDAVHQAALEAFDGASNPNRTRGGVKKSSDIIRSLPKTVPPSLPARKEVEALVSAAHALSTYKLALKQGEPFTPVMLRVHSDPISIIEKVLAQNTGAYTRLSEFLEMGSNLIKAGVLAHERSRTIRQEQHNAVADENNAEKRIISLCITAALREDDFETAYSYVVSRLVQSNSSTSNDPWSWRAALEAGQYVRTSRSQVPTHLGISSGNPEIRHLEQRLECLATALRVAPDDCLQGVLENFRQCEGKLEHAIAQEAASEEALESSNVGNIPGSFLDRDTVKSYVPRNGTASAASKQGDEAPMSLFDLSRATAQVASRNFTALSNLRGLAQVSTEKDVSENSDGQAEETRMRKRDQFRDAATGTLVSGVGWLIGAKPPS